MRRRGESGRGGGWGGGGVEKREGWGGVGALTVTVQSVYHLEVPTAKADQ